MMPSLLALARTAVYPAFRMAWHRTPYVEGGWVGWPSQARPAQATMEVASLAVKGWPVEVEVTATYGRH
jgi:enamine deaminase RidA (YjgF/YER057c/UK114 family)